MTWSLMLPLLFQFILFKKLESLPSCTSGTICFNASMVPTLPNRATEPSGWWQIRPNPWKNTGGDEWKYIWGQISVRWNLCPNPCFAQVFSTHSLVSLVTLVGFLPSPHFDKNLNSCTQSKTDSRGIQCRHTWPQTWYRSSIECPASTKTCSLSGHFSFRTCLGHPLAQMPVPKLSKTQSANIRNRFYVLIHLYLTYFRIFSGFPRSSWWLTIWPSLHFSCINQSEPTVSVASFKAIHASAMLAPLTLTWREQLKESEATAIAVYNGNGSFRDMASKKPNWNKKQVFLTYAQGLWLVIRLTMEMDNLLEWTGLRTLAIKWKLESKDKPLAWRHAAFSASHHHLSKEPVIPP